jgi:hypothetical protein
MVAIIYFVIVVVPAQLPPRPPAAPMRPQHEPRSHNAVSSSFFRMPSRFPIPGPSSYGPFSSSPALSTRSPALCASLPQGFLHPCRYRTVRILQPMPMPMNPLPNAGSLLEPPTDIFCRPKSIFTCELRRPTRSTRVGKQTCVYVPSPSMSLPSINRLPAHSPFSLSDLLSIPSFSFLPTFRHS